MSNNDENAAIIRHIHGATVVHRSPFSSIEVPSAEDVLSWDECERWVVPFYRVSLTTVDNGFMDSLRKIYPEITVSMVDRLLTEYDWRPRLTGAFFAALKRLEALEDHIGRLLLRSDLCYAGKFYCLALAELNTPKGLDYLIQYLNYYLTRPELDYDQGDAMGAIAYLDVKNTTNHLERLRPAWNTYVGVKTWKPNLENAAERFTEEMRILQECRVKVES